jgi:dTMP kinase
MPKGKFITFEGPEGCGKSSQIKLLSDALVKEGRIVLTTREPGGTDVGEEIRKILMNPEHVELTDLTEVFLYEAARAQIVNEVIIPALDSGHIVLCDRFSESTLAYQGYGGKISVEWIQKIDQMARGGLSPDLTLFIDVNPEVGLKRARASKKEIDRLEEKDLEYHKRVYQGYLELAKKNPDRIKIVDGRKGVQEVHQEILKLARGIL